MTIFYKVYIFSNLVLQCDQTGTKDAISSSWSSWLTWKVEGVNSLSKFHTIWILSRRRFCIDQDNNLVCAIEEIQRGHWKERKDLKNQFLNGINNPICAHEKSFETYNIEIVP